MADARSVHLPVFASISVPPEAGRSITPVAGTTRNRPPRAIFFSGARLSLARFAATDFATLRGLLRLAELPRRSFARFGFDAFLRLAMIAPAVAVSSIAYCRMKSQTANAASN
jgi:hypothetical protein